MTPRRPFQRFGGADASARRPYDIISELSGNDYRGLLVSATAHCDSAVLVFKTQLRGPSSSDLLDRLHDHMVAEADMPLGYMVRFRFNAGVAEILASVVDGLYGWRSPELPEDLCLFRRDGSPWLVTVSAEKLGYVEVTSFEKLLLGRSAPGLPPALAHQGARDAILAVMERNLESSLADLTRRVTEYATALADDGRDGLVEALGQWLDSGEASRVSVALDVIADLGLDELLDEVQSLSQAAGRDSLAVPQVFRSSAVLGQRWREMHRLQLDRVLTRLNESRAK